MAKADVHDLRPLNAGRTEFFGRRKTDVLGRGIEVSGFWFFVSGWLLTSATITRNYKPETKLGESFSAGFCAGSQRTQYGKKNNCVYQASGSLRKSEPGTSNRSSARSARRKHHGVLQGV